MGFEATLQSLLGLLLVLFFDRVPTLFSPVSALVYPGFEVMVTEKAAALSSCGYGRARVSLLCGQVSLTLCRAGFRTVVPVSVNDKTWSFLVGAETVSFNLTFQEEN